MLVEIKCSNCKKVNVVDIGCDTIYKCDKCETVILTKVITEDFSKSSSTFKVNVVNSLDSFDVETRIINKKIADAENLLLNRNFNSGILNGCPETPYVLRLKLLHTAKAKNEYELSLTSKKLPSKLLEDFLKVCDEETKSVYKKIEQEIENNILIEQEIFNVDKLLNAGLQEDAYEYAKLILEKYPNKAQAHFRYLHAKRRYLDTVKYAELKKYSNYWSVIADVIILKHNDEFISGLEALKSAPDYEIIMRDYTSKYDFEHSTDYILRAVILENNDLESKRATNPEAIKFVKEERKRLEKERKEKEKLAKKK